MAAALRQRVCRRTVSGRFGSCGRASRERARPFGSNKVASRATYSNTNTSRVVHDCCAHVHSIVGVVSDVVLSSWLGPDLGEIAVPVTGRDPAIHEEVAAADESTLRAHQQRRDGGDLVRRARPPCRRSLDHTAIPSALRPGQFVQKALRRRLAGQRPNARHADRNFAMVASEQAGVYA